MENMRELNMGELEQINGGQSIQQDIENIGGDIINTGTHVLTNKVVSGIIDNIFNDADDFAARK